jgi:hypothetical protein
MVAVYGTSEREHPVKKTLWFAATALAVALTGWGVGLAVTEPASGTPEHNGTLTATCEGVTALFVNFPDGEHDVTFYIGDAETDSSFNGTSGSVFVPWDFTAGGSYQIGVAWSADGGGQAGPITFDASGCVPPDTTEPPGPPPCFDPYTPGVPGCPTIPPPPPDVCEGGSLPPCVDPDITVVPPPPAGPVEGSPRSTG